MGAIADRFGVLAVSVRQIRAEFEMIRRLLVNAAYGSRIVRVR